MLLSRGSFAAYVCRSMWQARGESGRTAVAVAPWSSPYMSTLGRNRAPPLHSPRPTRPYHHTLAALDTMQRHLSITYTAGKVLG